MTHVFLDTGVLGMIVHVGNDGELAECKKWFQATVEKGALFYVPEISDYELRRELIRMNSSKSIARLDALKKAIGFVPITSPAMLRASELWAEARANGKPTAADAALDGDVILAAQLQTHEAGAEATVVATTNVSHLSQFCVAKKWQEIAI